MWVDRRRQPLNDYVGMLCKLSHRQATDIVRGELCGCGVAPRSSCCAGGCTIPAASGYDPGIGTVVMKRELMPAMRWLRGLNQCPQRDPRLRCAQLGTLY